jgi:O-antigen/teichoic acid export membrane protein
MPIIIKTVGVSIYGGFVLLSSILGIAFGLSSFGAGFRAKRFLPTAETISDRRDLFYPQFFFGLLSIGFFSALLLILDNQINAHFFKNEISYSPLIIPFFLIFYFLYSQGSDYFRYTSRVHYMTVAGLLFPYIHIALILIYFYLYRSISINMLMILLSLSALLIAIPCFCIAFKEMGIRFTFYNIKGLISDIKLGFPLVINFIFDFILAGSDRYFIAFYLSVTDVGFYTPGYVLGSLVILVPKAMGGALPQLMSKAVDNQYEYEAQQMLNYSIKIFILLTIPFIIGSMALGKTILSLIANVEIAENAYWVTPIVAVGILFYGLNILLSNVMYVRLKTHAVLKMNLWAAAFSLLSNVILFYFFKSIIVAALTSFASYFVAFLYISHSVRREKWPIDYQPAVVLKSIAGSLVMFTFLSLLPSNINNRPSVILLIGKLFSGISIYFITIFAFRTFTKNELSLLKRILYRQVI